MTQIQNSSLFSITNETERQVSLNIPSLYHDKERSAILQTLLLKREAIKMVLIESEENTVNIFFDPNKLARENLFFLLEKILNHFSKKPHQKTEKITDSIKDHELKGDFLFKVEGMSCESCALFLEMVLAREEAIIQTNIDYNSKLGTVFGYLSGEKIFEIIEKNGYQAHPIEKNDNKG